MNEDDTFRKLKSLTEAEVEVLYQKIWIQLSIELESQGVDISGGIPASIIRERCDDEFKPYGWTYDRLFPWNAGIWS